MIEVNEKKQNKTAVALGNFDGLHLGHRAVIAPVAAKAGEGLEAYAMTFDAHPRAVLSGTAPKCLFEGRLKEREFAGLGVGLLSCDFSEVVDMTPEEFFEKILIGKYNAAFLSCGYNFTFGSHAAGNADTLRALCREHKTELFVADEVMYKGEAVSSTRIRQALAFGDAASAAAMLGRPFSYDFTVVSGDRRGRLLGFPTINQFFPEDYTVPKYGVYISDAVVDGKALRAVTNIGLRPTVGTETARSETCILDFSGNLYGKNIEVRLLEYLRPEIKFADFEQLSAQMRLDAAKAQQL